MKNLFKILFLSSAIFSPQIFGEMSISEKRIYNKLKRKANPKQVELTQSTYEKRNSGEEFKHVGFNNQFKLINFKSSSLSYTWFSSHDGKLAYNQIINSKGTNTWVGTRRKQIEINYPGKIIERNFINGSWESNELGKTDEAHLEKYFTLNKAFKKTYPSNKSVSFDNTQTNSVFN